MKFLIGLIFSLILVSVVHSSHCQVIRSVPYQYPTYTTSTIVQAPLIVPTITVQYTGESQIQKEVRELKELFLKSLKTEQKVQEIQKNGQAVKLPNFQTILVQKCMSCHETNVAKSSGGGLAFFDGLKLLPLSADLKVAIVNQVYSGKMPKRDKCSDEEVAAIVIGVTQ